MNSPLSIQGTVAGSDPRRILLVGPLLSGHKGHSITQGERLTELFRSNGHSVLAVSAIKSRILRLADISQAVLRARGRVDLAVVMAFSGPGFVATDLATRLTRLAGIPTVISLHGGGLPRHFERFRRWSRQVLARGAMLVSQSRYHADALLELGFETAIVPNVLDLRGYPHRRRNKVRPRLFWMRGFHSNYNPHMAVRVLAELRERHPGASLIMAGPDCGAQRSVERLARRLGVRDAVEFPGFLDLRGKIAAGDRADIFLNTNRVDNRPLAVIEAAALGMPIVATRVGGIPHLLQDDRDALLVPDEDVEKMARAVERLCRNDELARRLSERGVELAAPSAPAAVQAGWDAVFDRICRSPTPEASCALPS